MNKKHISLILITLTLHSASINAMHASRILRHSTTLPNQSFIACNPYTAATLCVAQRLMQTSRAVRNSLDTEISYDGIEVKVRNKKDTQLIQLTAQLNDDRAFTQTAVEQSLIGPRTAAQFLAIQNEKQQNRDAYALVYFDREIHCSVEIPHTAIPHDLISAENQLDPFSHLQPIQPQSVTARIVGLFYGLQYFHLLSPARRENMSNFFKNGGRIIQPVSPDPNAMTLTTEVRSHLLESNTNSWNLLQKASPNDLATQLIATHMLPSEDRDKIHDAYTRSHQFPGIMWFNTTIPNKSFDQLWEQQHDLQINSSKVKE